MVAIRSAFETGLASEAAKRLFVVVSCGLYALTEIIGTLEFLFDVLLMYLAALSPSTTGICRSIRMQSNSTRQR